MGTSLPYPKITLTGFVLAGGQSTRMGSDKALIDFGGETLLERAIARLSQVCAEVFIVGPASRYAAFGAVIEDVITEVGPLGGIHAALSNSSTEFNVVVPVDTPFLSTNALNLLTQVAVESGAQCVLPEHQGRVHPLIGVYRKTILEVVERSIAERRLRVIDAVADHAHVVSESELRAAGISENEFMNVNCAEDFRLAKRRVLERTR